MPTWSEDGRTCEEPRGAPECHAGDTAVDAAVAWLAGGVDTLVARLVDELPDLRDHVLFPLRYALTCATAGTVDARWRYGYAAGVAAQAGLTWATAVLQRVARCEGWVTPWPPWSPLDVNVAVTMTDAVDRAVDELARACIDPALDAAEVWIAGGLDALTLRIARAVPAQSADVAVGSLRIHLDVAAGYFSSDRISDRFWMLGRASGIARTLDLDRVDSALTSLALAYKEQQDGTDGEPRWPTVGVVEAAVEELRRRFGDVDG